MMRIHLLFALVISILFISCKTSRSNNSSTTLSATDLHTYGRSFFNNDQNLELISSAAHFGFTFEGEECHIYVSIPKGSAHNYLQYELDGAYEKRIKVSEVSTDYFTIKAKNSAKHTVWIYKATEAHTGPICIQKITAKSITAIKKPDVPYIEFIGNSITCGAAADASEVPCGAGAYHDQHNAYYAYGPRLARAIGANYVLSSVSGIGIYRNWNSDGPAMPQLYEKLNFQQDASKNWDFKKYTPKVVSIALGTNDFSRGDGKKARLPFDSAAFVDNYIKFIQLVKSKYPASQIVL
jgi:hypothetical protein